MSNIVWLPSFLTDSVLTLLYFRRVTYAPGHQRRWLGAVLLLLLMPFYNGGALLPFDGAIVRILARALIYFCILCFGEGVPAKVSIYAALFWTAVYTLFQSIFFGPYLNPIFKEGGPVLASPLWNWILLSVAAIAIRTLYFAVIALLLPFSGMVGADWANIGFASAICLISAYTKTTGKDFTPDFADAAVPFSAYYILLNVALLLLLLIYEYSRRHMLEAAVLRIRNTEAQALLESIQGRHHSEESIRALRHDLKNHAITLQLLLEHGDMQGALKYLDTFQGQASTPVGTFCTGNDLLDGLLRQKLSPALERGTKAEVSLDFRAGDFITPFDLCILMGNVLDNAVEACLALPAAVPSFIEVSGGSSANCLLIRVENSCAAGLPLVGGLPRTSKADTLFHGFGLRNIRQVLDRYGGNLTVSAQDEGRFVVTMLIPISECGDSFNPK